MGLRKSYSSALSGELDPSAETLPAGISFDEAASSALAGYQLSPEQQRKEIADKDSEIKAMEFSKRDITVSTVPVDKLTGISTLKTVESWLLQFTTNVYLKVMENIAPESRQTIEYKANMRALACGDDWITFSDPEIIQLIKSCFPQQSEGQELSATQYVEKMKASAHFVFSRKR